MARRKAYSKVKKHGQIRADHVKGMGDVVFKVFQCLNPYCENFITVREDQLNGDFKIVCEKCSYSMYAGGETTFFQYDMEVDHDGARIIAESGNFTVLHEEYVYEAEKFKYCIVCNTMKPLSYFDNHRSRDSGRQGECRLCKKIYNSIKNGTRTSDQHRESTQKRRMYMDLSGDEKIISKEIYERYNYRCFKCKKDLSSVESSIERHLDHTLPVYYLWPLNTKNATLLCRKCNGEKSGNWPTEFYNTSEIQYLTVLTGYPFELLNGEPTYNPEALERLSDPEVVDELLVKYSRYIGEIIKLRNRLLRDINFDFFKYSNTISSIWIDQADKSL
ncbi:5-methylcytosine-specific restriction endonuclease McrA [Paenibacillus favisporus]|uniref:5-methylcytosine-specific restriction endonuclease McrA n=1 Tax=Paenibacillus favisporus TaxID=221028 RepID=A0ABV2F9A6_9BACL